MDNPVTIAGIILIAVVLIVLAYLSIRVVNEYERLVVFRLGKTGPERVKGPGLVFLIPIVDRAVKTDLREQFIEVPSQTNITRDNAPINIDFLIYWRIVDPMRSVVNVANFAGALAGHQHDHASCRHRRHPARRRAQQARADQRGAAHQAR